MLVLVATISVVNPGWYPVVQARLYDALGPASGLALTDGALFPVERAAPARDRRHNGALLAFVPGCSRRRHP
jgi:hypothetical protein